MQVVIRNPKLMLLFAILLIVILGFAIIIPVLPFFARHLEVTSFEYGLVITSYALAQLVAAPKWGELSDERGRKPIMVMGMLGFGIIFFLTPFAWDAASLIGARIIGGLFSAAAIPTAKAYVADVTPPEDRSAAMGVVGAAFGLGLTLGPAMGGVLAPYGYAVPFFVAAGMAVLTAVLAWYILPEPEEREEAELRPQLLEAVKLAATSNNSLWYWLTLFVQFAQSAMITMVGYYVIDRIAGTEAHLSILFAVLGVVGFTVQGLIIDWMSKRFGDVNSLMVGLVGGVVGFAAMAAAFSFETILLAMIFIGAGMALARPLTTAILSKRTRMGQGTALGIQSSFDSLGRVLGPMWAGWLYAINITLPFTSSAAILLITLGAAWWALRRSAARGDAPHPPGAPSGRDGQPASEDA